MNMNVIVQKLPLLKSGIDLSITRKALNINHVVDIICRYQDCEDISKAIRESFDTKFIKN